VNVVADLVRVRIIRVVASEAPYTCVCKVSRIACSQADGVDGGDKALTRATAFKVTLHLKLQARLCSDVDPHLEVALRFRDAACIRPEANGEFRPQGELGAKVHVYLERGRSWIIRAAVLEFESVDVRGKG
jgi:hypothetical protein